MMVYVPTPIGNASLGMMNLQIALTVVGICLLMLVVVLVDRYHHKHPDLKWQAELRERNLEAGRARLKAELKCEEEELIAKIEREKAGKRGT